MIEILCHRERANSPMLVGEPGVGKTAVVEGLARLIELEPEKVPARLRDSHIVQLQMGGLVAGTMLRGMFEERIKGIIDEVKESDNIILFIDEAHTIIGAGAALGTSVGRGQHVQVGARARRDAHHRRDDASPNTRSTSPRTKRSRAASAWSRSTSRRIDETREILFGLRPRLEKNYSVTISDEAINTALEMAPKYIRNLHLPDKAIGWLDTASVKVEINEPDDAGRQARAHHRRHLAGVAHPARHDLPRHDRPLLDDGGAILASRVIGQKEAVRAVAQRLRLNKGPLKENPLQAGRRAALPRPDGRRQDRAGEGRCRVYVRRRGEDGPHRHDRVRRRHGRHREADRHAARHRRQRARRHPDRAACARTRTRSCCSTKSRRLRRT